MKLVVYHAGGRLEKLEKCVATEFTAIPRNDLPLNDFSDKGHPFLPPGAPTPMPAADAAPSTAKGKAAKSTAVTPSPLAASCLQQVYYVVPVKEIYKLNLSWVITPSLQSAYARKPLHYAEHLLGHESAGSLYSLLRAKGWITSLVAGVNESGNYRNTAFECLQLTLSMTKDGSERVNDILDYVFQYLALIRQPSNVRESIYRELQQLAEIGFLFSEAQAPEDMVQDHACGMHVYKPEDIVRGDWMHEAFDRDLTMSVLQRLTIENCRIDIAVPANKSRPHLKKAPWFHTQWTSEPLAPELVAKWSSYDAHPEAIHADLHLPAPNAFVPTDFAINTHTTAEEARAQTENHGPVLLRATPRGQYWHQLDETFQLPRAHVHLLLESPAVYTGPAAVAASELLIKLWVDSVNEYAYQASLAELEFSIESLRSGIELKFGGFHHKLVHFVAKIVEGLTDLEAFLSRPDAATRFESMREKTTRHFRHLYYVPMKQVNHARLTVLQKDKYAIEEITEACRALTIDAIKAHARAVLASLRIVGLVDGNVAKTDATHMFTTLETILARHVQPQPAPPRTELTLALPVGHCVYVEQRARNPRESNHAVEAYWQIGERATIFHRAILNLLEALITEPAFDQLRTVEQLGYQVTSGLRNTHGVLGFVIAIQSAAYEPTHLAARIASFLWHTFHRQLLGMPAAKFETQRATLAAEFLYADAHLGERVDRNWEEITETAAKAGAAHRPCFARPQLMAQQVARVTHEQVVQFYQHFFLGIRAEPPMPPPATATALEVDDAAMAVDDTAAARASPSPSPDDAASAVSSIQLDPAAEEAKRKADRKLAKKARTAEARAAKQQQAASASSSTKDPAAEAALTKQVADAKLQPVLYRRHLIVCVHGHATVKKKSRNIQSGSDQEEEGEDDEGEDEEMAGSEEEDDDEEQGSEGPSGDEADDGSEGSGDDEPDAATDPTAPDSLWLTADEWRERLEHAAAKAAENSSAAAVQPPTKKQRNGRHKQTHTASSATSAATAASSPNATAALLSVLPSPAPTRIRLADDGVSTNCACAPASSSSAATTTAAVTSTPMQASELEHVLRVRTYATLQALKASADFFADCSGCEPDLPPSLIAKH